MLLLIAMVCTLRLGNPIVLHCRLGQSQVVTVMIATSCGRVADMHGCTNSQQALPGLTPQCKHFCLRCMYGQYSWTESVSCLLVPEYPATVAKVRCLCTRNSSLRASLCAASQEHACMC